MVIENAQSEEPKGEAEKKKVLTLEDVRDEARKKLKGYCAVYRTCDGNDTRLCEGHSYGSPINMGGMGSGASFNNNLKALDSIQIKPRLVGSHFTPDIRFNFFGLELSMPIMGAPASGVNSFGGEQVITESEFCQDVVMGCKLAGTIGWRGDSFNYDLDHMWGVDATAKAGRGVQIIKPRKQDIIIKMFKKAELAGCTAVGVDIEGCGSDAMARHQQPTFRKSVKDIRELVSATSLPVIIKGIMCVEDAISVVDTGIAGIVVSNHGGRVLDHTPGTAQVLPDIAAAVRKRIPVFVDGGIRTGYDVLKMLALGANGVLVGRDLVRAAVGGGVEGVKLNMEYLGQTLSKAMLMTNCKNIKEITGDILY